MIGFAILLAFYMLGTVIQVGLHVPLPANVIGLILFTLCLFLRIVKIEWVEDASQFLIKNMLMLFAPFVVGTMVFFSLIGQEAVLMLISLFASTFGVLLITGWITKLSVGQSAGTKSKERQL
ncbi:CidA/LrgA family protein [Paenibacillus cremeus]|uniref:CidA/LrgA family protein n=1 Tax=Paenibacillus cremeus TaxID=2163881 RepID=A0A559KDF6_9BACL|nr:CidA/LrgA family protein [Paenibacillus cremeus]TVY10133.1 CidA/LrgA family protein [Paenibacillus cremeus]